MSLWRYAWAAPSTLLGVAALLALAAAGARLRVVGGVLEASAMPRGRIGRGLVERLPFEAITLGHVVIARSPRAMALCRAHERVHVRQCERWGPLFVPAYLAASAWQWLRGRDAYLDNPFEVQARRQS